MAKQILSFFMLMILQALFCHGAVDQQSAPPVDVRHSVEYKVTLEVPQGALLLAPDRFPGLISDSVAHAATIDTVLMTTTINVPVLLVEELSIREGLRVGLRIMRVLTRIGLGRLSRNFDKSSYLDGKGGD
ncbi:MAG: hypothetical protein GY835_11015 [bacterium]|nr:hypothetical protein [bacterium]